MMSHNREVGIVVWAMHEGLVDIEAVFRWADRLLADLPKAPPWLIDLLMFTPQHPEDIRRLLTPLIEPPAAWDKVQIIVHSHIRRNSREIDTWSKLFRVSITDANGEYDRRLDELGDALIDWDHCEHLDHPDADVRYRLRSIMHQISQQSDEAARILERAN